jgi:hypothetical protein
MKILKHSRRLPLLLTLAVASLLAVPATATAAQSPVTLGTTVTFAVLAGSAITNTGPTTITGDVGLHPGTAYTGGAQVTLNGALHVTDAVALQAKNDLITAYNDAAGRTPVTRIPTQLGGRTLTPGVYDSASGTFQITGVLTLDSQGDPNAVFVFLTASTLITASDSTVNPINGARYCRIFWKVGSSATLGTNSHFVGHILANTSITANTAAWVQGQLLAMGGAVTLDTNIIINADCTADQLTTTTTRPTSTTSSTPTTSPASTTTTTVWTPTSTTTTSTTTTTTTASTTTTTTRPASTTSTTRPASTTTTRPASTTTTRPASTTSTTYHREEFPNTGGPPWYYVLLLVIAALVLVGAVSRRIVSR